MDKIQLTEHGAHNIVEKLWNCSYKLPFGNNLSPFLWSTDRSVNASRSGIQGGWYKEISTGCREIAFCQVGLFAPPGRQNSYRQTGYIGLWRTVPKKTIRRERRCGKCGDMCPSERVSSNVVNSLNWVPADENDVGTYLTFRERFWAIALQGRCGAHQAQQLGEGRHCPGAA